MSTRKIAVISAGLRVPSSTRLLADRLAVAATDALRKRGANATAEVIDLRDHAHAVTDHLLTGLPSATLRPVLDTVTDADALIAATPIFNASYNGLFKSFVDVLEPDALTGRPVLIAATGSTPRHALALEHALRPLFSHLHALVVPTAVYAASEDWGSTGASHRSLTARITRATTELAALLTNRAPNPVENLLPGS